MSQVSPAAVPTTQQGSEQRRHMRRVLLSSYLGSAVEFYDFLVYGTAASLVFVHIFFADLDPVVGTIASFGTLAVGYLARPIGGIIFGHFGDRLGRKKMLVLTMSLMGGASTAIGLLPTQAQVGVLAPLLLITLRVVQGIAVGGEWGGATLMALEHSDGRKRGLAAAIVNSGAPTGAVLAATIMGLFSLLPEDDFMSWGWRVPFLLSAILVVISLWIRLSVTESPLFTQALAQAARVGQERKSPLAQVLREPKSVILTCLSGAGATAFQSLMATFGLTYAVLGGADRSTALFAAAVGAAVNIVTIPLSGALSDRVGRRPVLLGGFGIGVVLVYPILSMLGSGSTALLFTGYILGYGLVVGCLFGTLSSFISEQFRTTSRYTGSSLGYQLAATLGAGFAPLIAVQLLDAGGGSDATFVAVFAAAAFLISACAVLLTRESFRTDISH
ncbi:MFS transporter [Rhodococcoides yunnanense]|uniref:MFS transporter n=1 Tax=Rhodococcoides yunnanense TaxID=278209 RepID=A0ABU4BA79_9NOCA|nr:MFS transporter [Rhodococcus yunnanensis]MDV6261100.1 MFS transporter [Rhodococcus yunnanensis]